MFKDAHDYHQYYDQSQYQGHILQRHKLPMIPILELELFDVWGIDSIGLFVSSYEMEFILVVVDYVFKLVEVVVLPNNEGQSATAFLTKKNFFWIWARAIICDGGSHIYYHLCKAQL